MAPEYAPSSYLSGKVTGPLKDAERNDLVVIHYPKTETKPKTPPKKKSRKKKKKKR